MSRIIAWIEFSPTSANHQDQSVFGISQPNRFSNLGDTHLNL